MNSHASANRFLEVNGYLLIFKGYLKAPAFSYRCSNFHTSNCPYLFTVPFNELNYDPETMECIGLNGARQASTSGHCEKCVKKRKQKEELRVVMENSQLLSNSNDANQSQTFSEWRSDIEILQNYIRHHLSLGPKSLRAKMKELKQKFSLRVIKDTKREIFDEIFPRNKAIAFHPSNCLILHSEDNYQDSLFKGSMQFPKLSRGKRTDSDELKLHEFHIFSTHTMLYQLHKAHQYFIDGTFAIAPPGFQQVLIVMVLIPELNIFYPGCFILLTNKTERIYRLAFETLISIAKLEGFKLNPILVMTDFEAALRNAIKSSFLSPNGMEEPKLVGCFFHYVKALIKKAKELRLITKNIYDDKTKLLIGLLKIFAHCPAEKREEFFKEIESIYKTAGDKFKSFLGYFKRQWLNDPFLEDLRRAYTINQDIRFIRTNNPCELFNKYLSDF